MAFKLRSGNKLSFKSMGSSPAKDSIQIRKQVGKNKDGTPKYDWVSDGHEHPHPSGYSDQKYGINNNISYYQTKPSKKVESKEVESKDKPEKTPAKQMTDFSNVTVDGEDAKTVSERNIKERNKRKKEKEKEMQDLLDNPDQSINRDKHRKENMMPPPNKQIELAVLRKRKGLGPREIQGEDDQSYEAAVTRSEMRMNKEYPYYYKINGQRVSKEAYIKYKNKPGGDEPGKQTNDPDVYGRKANNHGRGKKTK
jgi:hypothetical protein